MPERESRSIYYYKDKKYSRRGLASLVLALLSLLLLVILTALAQAGIRSSVTGAVGFTAMMMALVGVVEGLISFSDGFVRSYAVSKAGTILSGLIFALWFLIFCIGMAA